MTKILSVVLGLRVVHFRFDDSHDFKKKVSTTGDFFHYPCDSERKGQREGGSGLHQKKEIKKRKTTKI